MYRQIGPREDYENLELYEDAVKHLDATIEGSTIHYSGKNMSPKEKPGHIIIAADVIEQATSGLVKLFSASKFSVNPNVSRTWEKTNEFVLRIPGSCDAPK